MSHASSPVPRLNHGAIGNGRVLALVSPTSAIEWLCLPRFDSPSIFARLLDAEQFIGFLRDVAELRPYTFSRAMCWAAIERGAKVARLLGHGALAERWERIAVSERKEVLRRGFNERLGFFTQALDGEHPDASNLLLPTIGLLDGRDPRFLATLDAYETRLVRGGLMLRYVNEDDFGETTSAFTICSFWWAEALALAGRLDEAVQVFERIAALANPLGLFSEDVEPETGALLGNFPQAYTHVGLIHAAITIGELIDARDGRVRAWA